MSVVVFEMNCGKGSDPPAATPAAPGIDMLRTRVLLLTLLEPGSTVESDLLIQA